MDSYKKARDKCYRLLTQRPHTEYELRQKLKSMKITTPEEINAVIDMLSEQGLIDDQAFAVNWVRWRLSYKPVGKEFLRMELRYKGVSRKIIEESLSGYNDDMELEMALLAARKRQQYSGAKAWRKLAGFLARRGFSCEVIRKVGILLSDGYGTDIS